MDSKIWVHLLYQGSKDTATLPPPLDRRSSTHASSHTPKVDITACSGVFAQVSHVPNQESGVMSLPHQDMFVVAETFCDVGTSSWALDNNFTWGHLVKTEWLVADVTAVRSLDRAECATYFGGYCGWACFWSNQVIFYCRGATLWCRNPLLSSNNFT